MLFRWWPSSGSIGGQGVPIDDWLDDDSLDWLEYDDCAEEDWADDCPEDPPEDPPEPDDPGDPPEPDEPPDPEGWPDDPPDPDG